MTAFSNSYIITNRNTPAATSAANIYPLAHNELWFYTAPSQYDDEVSDYNPVSSSSSQTAPSAFMTSLIADLNIAIAANAPQLTVLVHGLGNLFSDSISELSVAGSRMQQYGNYGGLIISFDWPSFGMVDSTFSYSNHPYSFPPTETSGTVRANINGSIGAFLNLITMLLQVQTQLPSIQINFICHSEGNYMAMLGLNEALKAKQAPFINQVLLVAADINNGALQSSGSLPYTGQALPISALASQVTVYYSANDDVLPISVQLFGSFHDPSYLDRLGLSGPASFAAGALPSNTYGLDCSAVISDTVIDSMPTIVPPGTTSHSAYFYVPQVLQDWQNILMGDAESSVANRTANANAPDGQGFVMTFVAPPSAVPLPAKALARGV